MSGQEGSLSRILIENHKKNGLSVEEFLDSIMRFASKMGKIS